jgi:hypothetical protein
LLCCVSCKGAEVSKLKAKTANLKLKISDFKFQISDAMVFMPHDSLQLALLFVSQETAHS